MIGELIIAYNLAKCFIANWFSYISMSWQTIFGQFSLLKIKFYFNFIAHIAIELNVITVELTMYTHFSLHKHILIFQQIHKLNREFTLKTIAFRHIPTGTSTFMLCCLETINFSVNGIEMWLYWWWLLLVRRVKNWHSLMHLWNSLNLEFFCVPRQRWK